MLQEPVWVLRKLLTQDDVRVLDERLSSDFEGSYEAKLSRGLYGFQTIEARDKFCRKCNSAEEREDKVALPVTVPNIFMDMPLTTTIRQPDTAPVTAANPPPPKETE